MKTPPYIILDKKLGETPLAAIDAWRALDPSRTHLTACYAGRLDPMAEGRLLVLLGDECKRQKEYHGLDKEYEIEILLDLHTDTGDLLGMPKVSDRRTAPGAQDVVHALKLKEELGKKQVPYPPYSSKTVAGKPLFQYALEGTLDSIEMPMHEESIYRIRYAGISRISAPELHTRILDILSHAPRAAEPSKVLGTDFRQDEIRTAWDDLFRTLPEREFVSIRARVTCGTGTYMRSLAERVGERLGTSALAYSIRRTRIGRYRPLPFGTGIWVQEFR